MTRYPKISKKSKSNDPRLVWFHSFNMFQSEPGGSICPVFGIFRPNPPDLHRRKKTLRESGDPSTCLEAKWLEKLERTPLTKYLIHSDSFPFNGPGSLPVMRKQETDGILPGRHRSQRHIASSLSSLAWRRVHLQSSLPLVDLPERFSGAASLVWTPNRWSL